MSAGDILGMFLLIVLVGFVVAFIYLIFLQRRAVVTQAKATTQVVTMTDQQEATLANALRMTDLQEQSEQRQLRTLQIAEAQLVLQREHNELLRDLLAHLVNGEPADRQNGPA